MPLPAMLMRHGLFREKRRLTLKYAAVGALCQKTEKNCPRRDGGRSIQQTFQLLAHPPQHAALGQVNGVGGDAQRLRHLRRATTVAAARGRAALGPERKKAFL